jgi:hypothetical protein
MAGIDWSISASASLVPGPALCPGAGAAERSQETLYIEKFIENLNEVRKKFIYRLPKVFKIFFYVK